MQQLLVRANQGDITCLTELREILDNNPELWRKVGDLAQHAELTMLTIASERNLLIQESMQRKLAEMKENLAGPNPSPLEHLLVDRIAISWLQVHHADLDAAQSGGQESGLGSASFGQRVTGDICWQSGSSPR